MNETIQNNTDLSLKVMKQLERNSKNMIAKQGSQFFQSKYQKSKMLGSIYTNKSKFEFNMSTLKDNTNNHRMSDNLSNFAANNVHSAVPKNLKNDLLIKNDEEDETEELFQRQEYVKEEDERREEDIIE
jgi:hypothetical protein